MNKTHLTKLSRGRVSPRDAIARMGSEYGIREGRDDFLRLDFNENTIGCSPAVRAALARISCEKIATYPEYEATRRRLARHFRVDPSELVLTNGADEALRLVFDAFLERGDSLLLVHPTFPMYYLYAALFDIRIIRANYESHMHFPLDDVLRKLRSKPRVFFLTNPNNPTGTLIDTDEIRKILDAAHSTLIVVDEAYFEFCGVTVLPWIRRHPNLVVVRTFSKASGLAGLRLGCLLACAETALAFRKAQPPFPVNTAVLVAARAAVSDRRFAKKYVSEILRNRRELENFLNRCGVRSFPSGGNFLLVDFGPRAPQLLQALEKRKILVRDRTHDFGQAGFVRITIGSRPQMARLTQALEEIL